MLSTVLAKKFKRPSRVPWIYYTLTGFMSLLSLVTFVLLYNLTYILVLHSPQFRWPTFLFLTPLLLVPSAIDWDRHVATMPLHTLLEWLHIWSQNFCYNHLLPDVSSFGLFINCGQCPHIRFLLPLNRVPQTPVFSVNGSVIYYPGHTPFPYSLLSVHSKLVLCSSSNVLHSSSPSSGILKSHLLSTVIPHTHTHVYLCSSFVFLFL